MSGMDCFLTYDQTKRTGYLGVLTIVKNQNTFAKRAREMEKRHKAEEKRTRRKERKEAESALPQELTDEPTQEVDTPEIDNSSTDNN
jgi:hypothetical protein